MNENEMTTTLNFWNLLKSILWAKVIALIAYMKICERASKKSLNDTIKIAGINKNKPNPNQQMARNKKDQKRNY